MALGLGIYQGYVCPVMDARRQQVYNALFYVNQGTVTRVAPDRAIALEDLKKELAALSEPVYLVGDGATLCHRTLSGEVGNLVMPAGHRMHQRAVGVGLAALEKIRTGDPGDGKALVPNYLRLSQAERERLEKSGQLKAEN